MCCVKISARNKKVRVATDVLPHLLGICLSECTILGKQGVDVFFLMGFAK
jgi:hypothetical protein